VFVPSFYDNVCIIVYHFLYFLEVICFDALPLCKYEFSSIPFEFSNSVITFHMNVNWLMFSAIKEELKSKKSEYFGHNIGRFVSLLLQKKELFSIPPNNSSFFLSEHVS